MSDSYVDIDIDEVTAESGDAIQIRIDDLEVWIPKSQIDGEHDVDHLNKTKVVAVAEWLAIRKELV